MADLEIPVFDDGKENIIVRGITKWYEIRPEKAFWIFVIFASLVFLMGGGSRYDIESVGPLRAVSAIFLSIAIWFQTRETFSSIKIPVILLIALGVWMSVQLIPLPYEVWSQFAGRSVIAELDQLVGLGEIARPITLSPLRTLNSLQSMVVPLAALLLLSLLDASGWRRLLAFLVIVGVVSALLGIAQVTMRGATGLYFYDITNNYSAVGIFSNRNHNALLLNIALLSSIFRLDGKDDSRRKARDLIWLSGQVLLIVAILINGSRVSLVMLAFIGAVYAVRGLAPQRTRSKTPQKFRFVGLVVGLVSACLIAVFAFLDRIPAVQRLFQQSLGEDLRSRSMPYLIEMVQTYFPLGAGFGAFEQAYRAIEPVELLSPNYFNQAHDDWLQIVIEGGLPGLMLIATAIACLVWKAIKIQQSGSADKGVPSGRWLGLIILTLFAAHSIFDYPLRVPSLMLVAMIAIGLIFHTHPRGDDVRLR